MQMRFLNHQAGRGKVEIRRLKAMVRRVTDYDEDLYAHRLWSWGTWCEGTHENYTSIFWARKGREVLCS